MSDFPDVRHDVLHWCVEVRFFGNSVTPGECRVIARGDPEAMLALFPVVVAEARDRTYEMVAVYDTAWNSVACWSWKGVEA